jgi:lysophospholipase L1-like esterase
MKKHAFGEIGGLMLSLVQEQCKEDAPFTIVLFGGNDVFFPLGSFEPALEGFELAKITGEITLRALAVGHDNWSE